MKYIKTYEGIKFIDDNHRKLYNFSQRLERAINKYFKKTKKDPGYIYVDVIYNYKTNGDPIVSKTPFWMSNFSNRYHLDYNYDKYTIFNSELKRLEIHGRSMTIKQAEELLDSAKINFEVGSILHNAEKYNL